jgi:conjugal transfer/entry exclusion protein
MFRSLQRFLFVLVLTGLSSTFSDAQLLPGVGEIPVIDRTNLIENAATAIRMLEEIGLSGQQLETMLINLLFTEHLGSYPLPEYERILMAASAAAGPRPRQPRVLDYYNEDPKGMMQRWFPGSVYVKTYPEIYARRADLELNTMESIMMKMHEQAGRESDIRYEDARNELFMQTFQAQGNLQATQVNAGVGLLIADGVRRLEKSMAEVANATAIHGSMTRQREAFGEAFIEHSLKISGAEEGQISPYHGQGGVRFFPLRGAREF